MMLASKNLLKPASGTCHFSRKDMVLGVYYLTMELTESQKGEFSIYINEVLLAYQLQQESSHTYQIARYDLVYDKGDRMAAPERKSGNDGRSSNIQLLLLLFNKMQRLIKP